LFHTKDFVPYLSYSQSNEKILKNYYIKLLYIYIHTHTHTRVCVDLENVSPELIRLREI